MSQKSIVKSLENGSMLCSKEPIMAGVGVGGEDVGL